MGVLSLCSSHQHYKNTWPTLTDFHGSEQSIKFQTGTFLWCWTLSLVIYKASLDQELNINIMLKWALNPSGLNMLPFLFKVSGDLVLEEILGLWVSNAQNRTFCATGKAAQERQFISSIPITFLHNFIPSIFSIHSHLAPLPGKHFICLRFHYVWQAKPL